MPSKRKSYKKKPVFAPITQEAVGAVMGRPTLEFSIEQLSIFCRTLPELNETADYFKMSDNTLEKRIAEETGKTFVEFRELAFNSWTKKRLRETAIAKALMGDNDMLKFCLRAYCKDTDRLLNFNTTNNVLIKLAYSVDGETGQLPIDKSPNAIAQRAERILNEIEAEESESEDG